MYKVLLGCNVRLQEGEEWDGKVWEWADGRREARLEPGDQVEKLPALANIEWLLARGAIEPVSMVSGSDGPDGQAGGRHGKNSRAI